MALPQPRWYFDADTIGLGKLVAPARRDVTWPGDTGERGKERLRQEPSPITSTDTADELWIPRVTSYGMAIVTRDKHIQSRTSEIDAVMSSGARMFAITSAENLNRFGLLEVFMSRWRDIEEAAAEPGPYVYAVTRSQIRRLLPEG
jgi:hypothetical protein